MTWRPSVGRRAGLGSVFAFLLVFIAGGADARHPALVWTEHQTIRLVKNGVVLYQKTPADERVTWGGLGACALLGLSVTFNRLFCVRRSRVVPKAYTGRFHERLVSGKLDRGKALDFCELNPSPAARVVLAAVRRWGRPVGDMERGVSLARGIEIDHLRRHVGTLRRIAVLAPLIGLLGTLMAANRGLSTEGAVWAPVVARSLATLTAGVALAILSIVAYDGLAGRVETLAGLLDRLGAEAVDAIASAAESKPAVKAVPEKTVAPKVKFRRESANSSPAPHPARAEIPLEGGD